MAYLGITAPWLSSFLFLSDFFVVLLHSTVVIRACPDGLPEPGPEALSLGTRVMEPVGGDKVRAIGAWSPFSVLWVQLETWVLVGGALMEGGGRPRSWLL